MEEDQRAPNPPEFAQPCLSRSNGGHPQREGTNLGVFVPIWSVLPRCEATNLGVFDSVSFRPTQTGLCKLGVCLELADPRYTQALCEEVLPKHLGGSL